jgi:AraC-like DNA-binding protein|tara:strand:- start:724 stop:1530 length:807 start_codon:yes stop_codon:yes gene_type:complete
VPNLLTTIKQLKIEKGALPFSVYTSIKEQKLLSVPIAKPLLIVVLSGDKVLGTHDKVACHSGDFIFLSDSPAIDMRNIPKNQEYFALLVEFDHQDFRGLPVNLASKTNYFVGKTIPLLEKCLQQFVESSLWAPQALLSSRKREIIELLVHMGHDEVLSLLGSPSLKSRLHELFIAHGFRELTVQDICEHLAMSESSLRRKLKLEGSSVQEIKDQARLGLGFHLLQTTRQSIGLISDICGYQSQSRFSARFKRRFGLTPSELRYTKMAD